MFFYSIRFLINYWYMCFFCFFFSIEVLKHWTNTLSEISNSHSTKTIFPKRNILYLSCRQGWRRSVTLTWRLTVKARQTMVTTPELSLHNTDDQGITSHGDRPDSSIKKDNKEFIGIFIPNKTDGFFFSALTRRSRVPSQDYCTKSNERGFWKP